MLAGDLLQRPACLTLACAMLFSWKVAFVCTPVEKKIRNSLCFGIISHSFFYFKHVVGFFLLENAFLLDLDFTGAGVNQE